MAYEINDLKRTLILVFFAIPMIAARNINCSGRAFHCVNSTHFMICVDLGGGLSTTIDDFVIPCPATTVCHENNIFECDFPEVEVATPSLQVIDIFKHSDTSEKTLVTNSVTVPTPTSEILSVLKENITATTLPTPEAVTPVLKLDVLKDIKNDIGGNSDNTTDSYIQMNTTSLITTNKIINDKDTNNKTITTSDTDNNKNLETIVETSIHKPANTSLTDKTKSIDTATSVIGLINLISIDHPIVENQKSKSSSNVLTSLDIFNDNIVTTTEQYKTKQVIIQSTEIENVTDTVIISEGSVSTDEVTTTPVVNTFMKKDINSSIDNNSNKTIAKLNSINERNSTTELISETTTEYLSPVKIDNISDVTEVASSQTTTEKTFNAASIDSNNGKISGTKSPSDYLKTLNDNIVATIDQHVNIQKTILNNIDIPANAEVINATPTFNIQINETATNNAIFTKLNSAVDINTTEKVPEKKTNYFIPEEPITVDSLQTTTEKTLVPVSKETKIMHTTETTPTSEDLIKNYSHVQKHTTTIQPLEIIITTDTSIKMTDDLIRELNETVDNYSTKDIINDKIIESTLLQPTIIKHPTPINEVKNDPKNRFSSSTNEPYTNRKTNIVDSTENIKTVFNDLSTDFINNKNTETDFLAQTTLKYAAIEISPTETTQNVFTARPIQATSELPPTNVPISIYEPHIDNIGTNKVPSVHTTLNPYYGKSNTVINKIARNIASESDTVTNQQIDFIPDINNSTDQATTQKITIYSKTEIPGFVNQNENLGTASFQEKFNTNQWTDAVQNEGSMTTTYMNNNENSTTTTFPLAITENNIFSDINQSITSTPNVENTQDVLSTTTQFLSNNYVAELISTTPKTVQATSVSIDTEVLQEVSSYTPGLVHHYSVSTSGYKIETSTALPPDTTFTENIRDIPLKILQRDDLTGQKMDSVDKLNTTRTTPETITNLVPSAVTTPEFDVLHTKGIDPSTKSLESPVNTGPQIGTNVKTETVKPINSKNNATALSVDFIKGENIKIVSVPSVTQKTPKEMVSSIDTKVQNPDLVTTSTQTLLLIRKNTESNKYDRTEAPIPSTKVSEHMNPTKAAVTSNYVTEKTNDYIMPTEAILTQLNKLEVEFSSSSVSSTTPSLTVSSDDWAVPANNKITTIMTDSATMNAVDVTPKVVADDNMKISTEPQFSTLRVSTPKYNTEPSLTLPKISDEQLIKTTEPMDTTDGFITTTPLFETGKTNPDDMPKTNSTDLPLHLLPIVNNNISQSMPAQQIAGVTAPQTASEYTPTAITFAQRTSSISTMDKTNQDVLPGLKTTDFPTEVSSIVNNNISKPMLAQRIAKVAAPPIDSEPITATSKLVQTVPSPAISKTNSDVISEITTTDFPQNVLSVVNDNISQIEPAQYTSEVTAAEESTSTVITSVQITPSIATIDMTTQDVLPGPKTTDLPQKVLSIVNNNMPNPLLAEHKIGVDAGITFETIPVTTLPEITPSKSTDLPQSVFSVVNNVNIPQAGIPGVHTSSESTSTTNTLAQTTPSLATFDMIKQNIRPEIKTTDLPQLATGKYNNVQLMSDITTKYVIDSLTVPDYMVETIKVVGDQVDGDTISSDVITNNLKVHLNYSVKSVNHITDHESIIIGNTSKNNLQNTTIKPVDINKAEIVNHTESNWMPSDVNIDGVQIKEESIEEPETSTSLVIDSGMNPSKKTVNIISPKVIGVTSGPTHVIETGLNTTRNYTQPKTVIIKNNKKIENITSVHNNTENYEVRTESKNVTVNTRNTKPSVTTTFRNLSLQNSTINDELEQHLLSSNHTITTEIQSHVNESDKQSNKTSDKLLLNVTSMHKPNLAITKLNAASENKTGITVSTSVFNCLNHTRGKYADKNDCRKFYTCIGNLQPILGICPNNTVFSEINKQCTKNLSHCVRNNQFRCLLEGRFSDFFKDKIYYICVKNRIHGFIRYKLQCQDNYHLNKESVKCEKNKELSTQSTSSVSEITDESKPELKSAKIVASDNFECEKEGNFPYDKDCSKYYTCTKIKNVYRRKIKKCASEEVFDKKKKKCVESDSGEC